MNINDLKIQNQETKELDDLMKSLEPPLFYHIPLFSPPVKEKIHYSEVIGTRDWPESKEILKSFFEKGDRALQKMHSCPYAWQVTYLKCTANPTNKNCLECKAYEHHDSTEMDS
jgi:hypothetical protein